MTELSFLLDLLLNEKLPKSTRDKLLERIKEIEAGIKFVPSSPGLPVPIVPQARIAHGAPQSASTIAKLAAQEGAAPNEFLPPIPETVPAITLPVTQIAQTPQAVGALNDRAAAIRSGLSDKPEPGRTGPRKF